MQRHVGQSSTFDHAAPAVDVELPTSVKEHPMPSPQLSPIGRLRSPGHSVPRPLLRHMPLKPPIPAGAGASAAAAASGALAGTSAFFALSRELVRTSSAHLRLAADDAGDGSASNRASSGAAGQRPVEEVAAELDVAKREVAALDDEIHAHGGDDLWALGEARLPELMEQFYTRAGPEDEMDVDLLMRTLADAGQTPSRRDLITLMLEHGNGATVNVYQFVRVLRALEQANRSIFETLFL